MCGTKEQAELGLGGFLWIGYAGVAVSVSRTIRIVVAVSVSRTIRIVVAIAAV